jgi:hypothetical protein
MHKADILTDIGADCLETGEPQHFTTLCGLPWPVTGIALPFLYCQVLLYTVYSYTLYILDFREVVRSTVWFRRKLLI